MGGDTPRFVIAPDLAGDPPELLIFEEHGPCPYLPEETACLPMRMPIRPLKSPEFEQRLAGGDRRQGLLLYRPSCPTCRACEAIRLEVETFQPHRSHRRVQRKTGALVTVSRGPTDVCEERVSLYNRHKEHRNLAGDSDPIDMAGYSAFLVDSCADSFELRYRLDDKLIGVAIVDRASDSLSAVYTYWDPLQAELGLGTFSILVQLELCKLWSLRWLYLGLYVHGCEAMEYKARWTPHQRLVDGLWREFADPPKVGDPGRSLKVPDEGESPTGGRENG